MPKAATKSESSRGGSTSRIGHYAFLVGLILAVIMGLFVNSLGNWQAVALLIVFLLGIVVGLFNITASEVGPFLTSGTVLVLVSYLGSQVLTSAAEASVIATYLVNILSSVETLFVPATIIVALKAVFALAKD